MRGMQSVLTSSITRAIRGGRRSRRWRPSNYFPVAVGAAAGKGVGGYTFSRNDSDATVTDWEGLIHQAGAYELRFEGARRVENRFDPSAAPSSATGMTYTRSGDTFTVTVTGINVTLYWFTSVDTLDYRNSYSIRRISGSGGINVMRPSFAQVSLPASLFDDGEWHRASPIIANTGNPFTGIGGTGYTVGDVFEIKFQLESVDGQANQNPGEYVSVGAGTGVQMLNDPEFDTDVGASEVGPDFTMPSSNVTITGGAITWASTQVIATTSVHVVVGKLYHVQYEIAGANMSYFNAFGLQPGATIGVYDTVIRATQDSISWVGNAGTLLKYFRLTPVDHGANVDGVQYFPYENGNTVASNIVTEAVGDALTTLAGVRAEEQRINYANNADDLSGGADILDLTTPGTGDYTIWVTGTSVINVSAITAVGTNFGLVTPGNPRTINLTTAGTIQIAMGAGALDTALGLAVYQVEKGSNATSWIPNTAAGGTQRNADSLNFPISVMNEAEGTIYLEWIPDLAKADYIGGSHKSILTGSSANFATQIYIRNTDGAIRSYDGTNGNGSAESYAAGDTVKIALRYSESAGKFNICVNGVPATESTFAGWGAYYNDGVFLNTQGEAYGTFKNIKFWDVALTDAELEAMTA